MAFRMISAVSVPAISPVEIMVYISPWLTPLASASIPTAPIPRSFRMFRYSSVVLSLDFIRPKAVAMAVISLTDWPKAAPASPIVWRVGSMAL